MHTMTRRQFVLGIGVAAAAFNPDDEQDLVAACGLYCGACPNYLASQQNDEHRFKASVEQLSSGIWKSRREDLLCNGCRGGKILASFCQACVIRKCAGKKTESGRCSECLEFPCSRLSKMNDSGMPHQAELLENLRSIHKSGVKNWAKHEYERWHCPRCAGSISWYDPACLRCGAKRSGLLFPLKKP